MGAAYDAMCENDGLQSRIASKNRKIREQKKLIDELVKGICDYLPSNPNSPGTNALLEKAYKISIKQNNKKKK